MSATATTEAQEAVTEAQTTSPEAAAPRLRRVFMFNGTSLADPDPAKSPDDVRKHYAANGYATLTAGSITGPEEQNGKQVYTLKASVGTKG